MTSRQRLEFERGFRNAHIDLTYLGFVSEVSRFDEGSYGDGYRYRLAVNEVISRDRAEEILADAVGGVDDHATVLVRRRS